MPQPDQVIKAMNEFTIEQVRGVNEEVLPSFENAVEELITSCGGDTKEALTKAVALLSGCHQEPLPLRSLQSGQVDQVTFQIDTTKKLRSIG